MIHPSLIGQLASAHIDELRRSAKSRQPDSSARRPPRPRHGTDIRPDARPHKTPARSRDLPETAAPDLQAFTSAELSDVTDLFTGEGWPTYTVDAERALRALSDVGCTTLVALDGATVVALVKLPSDGAIRRSSSGGNAAASARFWWVTGKPDSN